MPLFKDAKAKTKKAHEVNLKAGLAAGKPKFQVLKGNIC